MVSAQLALFMAYSGAVLLNEWAAVRGNVVYSVRLCVLFCAKNLVWLHGIMVRFCTCILVLLDFGSMNV